MARFVIEKTSVRAEYHFVLKADNGEGHRDLGEVH